MLLSSNSTPHHKILLQCAAFKDGIRAWATFKAECAYDGSAELRIEQLKVLVAQMYSLDSLDGLAGYIDRFQSYIAELAILATNDISDTQKDRLLLRNISSTDGLVHLVQSCRDDLTRFFDETATYLRKNAVLFDHTNSTIQPQKQIMNTQQDFEKPSLSLDEATKLFMTVAADQGLIHNLLPTGKSARQRSKPRHRFSLTILVIPKDSQRALVDLRLT